MSKIEGWLMGVASLVIPIVLVINGLWLVNLSDKRYERWCANHWQQSTYEFKYDDGCFVKTHKGWVLEKFIKVN